MCYLGKGYLCYPMCFPGNMYSVILQVVYPGKVLCKSVLKLSKVLCISLAIIHVNCVRSAPYLLATDMSTNLTNSSGVRLDIIVGAVVIVVVTVGTVYLITPMRIF
jgi:hypothetical protein